jgi:hypothetical protein
MTRQIQVTVSMMPAKYFGGVMETVEIERSGAQ